MNLYMILNLGFGQFKSFCVFWNVFPFELFRTAIINQAVSHYRAPILYQDSVYIYFSTRLAENQNRKQRVSSNLTGRTNRQNSSPQCLLASAYAQQKRVFLTSKCNASEIHSSCLYCYWIHVNIRCVQTAELLTSLLENT